MKLFQYAVIWHPTDEEKKEGDTSTLVVEPKTVLAKDLASAQMLAARAIPKEYETMLDQCEVAVRPF